MSAHESNPRIIIHLVMKMAYIGSVFFFLSLLQETMSTCCQLFKHFMETIKHKCIASKKKEYEFPVSNYKYALDKNRGKACKLL